ncbi:MAG: hypothetical protein HGA38_02285 [Candidatus Moranbacteria bacterium]|nr:hypothetical protein [Candidatus Moranbacteria bacterium]
METARTADAQGPQLITAVTLYIRNHLDGRFTRETETKFCGTPQQIMMGILSDGFGACSASDLRELLGRVKETYKTRMPPWALTRIHLSDLDALLEDIVRYAEKHLIEA